MAALTAGGENGGDGEVDVVYGGGDVEMAGSDQVLAHDGDGVCDVQMALMTKNCNQTTCMMTCYVEVEAQWTVTLQLIQWMSAGLREMRSMRLKMTK